MLSGLWYIDNNSIRYNGDWAEVVEFVVKHDMKEMKAKMAKMMSGMSRTSVVEKIIRNIIGNVRK